MNNEGKGIDEKNTPESSNEIPLENDSNNSTPKTQSDVSLNAEPISAASENVLENEKSTSNSAVLRNKIESEINKTRKKKISKKTWYNSRPFIFSFVVVIYLAAFVAMIYMDSDNFLRPKWMDSSIITDLFDTFGLKPFNVGIVAWLFFFLFTVIGASGFSALFFIKNIRDKQIRKRIAAKKVVDQKWLHRFNVVYTMIFSSIALFGVLVICVLMPWRYLSGPKNYDGAGVALNLLESMGILLIWIAIVPVFLGLIWGLLRLLVWLFGGFAGAIAKNMMTTGDYQDFKAAAEASAAQRRREAGLATPQDYNSAGVNNGGLPNAKVTLDPNSLSQLGLGQRSRNEQDRVGDLFPALMMIDHKWDEMHKHEEEEKNAKAKLELEQKIAQDKWTVDFAQAQKDWDAQCLLAKQNGTPEPSKPSILTSPSPDQIRNEAELKKQTENGNDGKTETLSIKEENRKAIIGTAVQQVFAGNENEIFEEARKNHKTMDYKDFTQLAYRFQSYLCYRQLYYPIDVIRSWIAGFSSSRLILLEGLSGTGKTTLPRMFLEFVGGKAFFFPVQATWRDRSDILGYYSDFTGQFKETEMLKSLYEASYIQKQINIMVLDEMNISRVEYYFADFLSIFEYPPSDWLVPLMQVKLGDVTPRYLEDGKVRIPVNTWFVGTVNIDDSTFTITDKVYDRAIVIDFKEINLPFDSDYPSDPYPLTLEEFAGCINDSLVKEENNLSEVEQDKFLRLTEFVGDTFDIRFGNRIMNQINRFVPVFVALGGTKEAALDIMFARKILRKLDGHFESYIKDGLVKLTRYLNQEYGKHVFKESEDLINRLNKKLS